MADEYIRREDALEKIERLRDKSGNEDMTFALNWAVKVVRELSAADVRPVIFCKDCEWWGKQVDSAQGRCMRLGIYPTGGWFCANGKREEVAGNG